MLLHSECGEYLKDHPMTTGYVVSITMVGDRFCPLAGSGGSSFQMSNEKKTWLVGLYRGLYYPIIWGL